MCVKPGMGGDMNGRIGSFKKVVLSIMRTEVAAPAGMGNGAMFCRVDSLEGGSADEGFVIYKGTGYK
jgi:hypothetical protein